jgi:hypothetical protein
MIRFVSAARIALASSLVLAAACGGTTDTVDPPGADPTGAGGGGGVGSGSEQPGGGAATGAGASGDGPQVTLALRGTTAPIAHADDFASQTPASQSVAVTSLWLLRSAEDPSPLKVVDLGTSAVETDLVSGKTNDIATVALRSLPAGTYTIAKVGVAWVRYRVAARLHDVVAIDGRYDNVEALSDGAVIDGTSRDKGWFRSEFGVGAATYGSYEGVNAPLPQRPSGGGMTLETSGPTAFYVFPMKVTIDPTETKDQRIVCEVNVHESFRWQDQAQPGYASKVFDTTPTTFEPVMSFGASGFSLLLEPK